MSITLQLDIFNADVSTVVFMVTEINCSFILSYAVEESVQNNSFLTANRLVTSFDT